MKDSGEEILRRRKSYAANSDWVGVMLHNRGAAADKRRSEQERARRRKEQEDEQYRRRQEKSEHYEAMRREKKERLRFEKVDDLLVSYRLPNAVTPWVIDYMDSQRRDLRYVKRELLEPLSQGKRSAAETIALLATDRDGDGTNEFEQLALLFDWYDLHDLGRPALFDYLLSSGLSIAQIESDLIKAIAGRDLTPAQVYDLICTSDETADPDPFVAQLVTDWGVGEEWVEPIVEVSRDVDLNFQEFQERFVPALLAELKLDTAAVQSAVEAHDEIERAAMRKTSISRWLASAVAFAGGTFLLPGGWPFALIAAVGVLGLSYILPPNTTGANFLWPAAAVAVGVLVSPFTGSASASFFHFLAIIGGAAVGMVATRIIEPGISDLVTPRRDPSEVARAAGAQVAQSNS